MNRRDFLHTFGIGAAVTGLGAFPYEALAAREIVKLTILHTNDVHSRIDPFPMDGGRNQGLGGAVRRASLIEKIRKEEKESPDKIKINTAYPEDRTYQYSL